MSQIVKFQVDSQLADVCNQFHVNSLRVTRLTSDLLHHQLNLRIEPDSWSIAECIVHLNLFSEAFVPVIQGACERARRDGLTKGGPYNMDVIGKLLRYALEPPSKWHATTTKEFVPLVVEPLETVIPRFIELQSEVLGLLQTSADLDLNRIKITSPISNRVRYNLYSCFMIIAAHQRRHLWQVDQSQRILVSNGKCR